MKLYRYLLTTLFITIFAVSSVMAMDFTDNPAVNELNSESVANASTFNGPYVISSITRTDSKTIKVVFTSGDYYNSTIASRQNTMGVALANNSTVYLLLDAGVIGVLALSD